MYDFRDYGCITATCVVVVLGMIAVAVIMLGI